MREPINGTIVNDDVFLALYGYDMAKKLCDTYGPVPIVKVMLEYYQALITELMHKGMAFGL